MSGLVFVLKPDEVVVLTDSLACAGPEKEEHIFCTKFFPLPHLNAVICGTGVLQVLLDWFHFVEEGMLARSVLVLDTYAPAQLCKIAEKYSRDLKQTSTIYHFGWDENDDTFVGFAYRSEKNFVSERLEYGLGIKPAYAEALDKLKEYPQADTVQRLVILMKELKTIDDTKSVEERVGIGGKIFLFCMTHNDQALVTSHRFEDFEEVWERMLDRSNKQNAQAAEAGEGCPEERKSSTS